MTDRTTNERRLGAIIAAASLITLGLIGSALILDAQPPQPAKPTRSFDYIGEANAPAFVNRLRLFSTVPDGATLTFNSSGSVTITVTDIPGIGTVTAEHSAGIRGATEAFLAKLAKARAERRFKP